MIQSDRVENMNLLLQRYVWNMVLFIKLLHLIHHRKKVWQNGRTKGNDECLNDQFWFAVKPLGKKTSLQVIKYSIDYPIEKQNQYHMSSRKEGNPT